MEEKMDLFLVIRRKDDVFPPLQHFNLEVFPFKGVITVHDIRPLLLEWPLRNHNEDFPKVLACIKSHFARIKTAYITQPFPHTDPRDKEKNMQFFRCVLLELTNLNMKFLIQPEEPSTIKSDLAALQSEFPGQKVQMVILSDNKIKTIFIMPQARPAPQDLSRSQSGPMPPVEETKEIRVRDRAYQMLEGRMMAGPLESMKSLQRHAWREEGKRQDERLMRPLQSAPVRPSSPPAVKEPESQSNPHSQIDFHEEDYRCIICLSIYREPFLTSCCNAIVCKHCGHRLVGKCPKCRQPLRLTTNLAVNRIFDGIKEACACGAEVSKKGYEDHQKVCPNRRFQCPCGYSASRPDFIHHLKTFHIESLLCRMHRLQMA